MAEPIFMKLGVQILAPERISTAYIISPSHQSVYYIHILGKNVTAPTNKHETIE
jgi:hypothetical protein